MFCFGALSGIESLAITRSIGQRPVPARPITNSSYFRIPAFPPRGSAYILGYSRKDRAGDAAGTMASDVEPGALDLAERP
jgi:hypothetical protein